MQNEQMSVDIQSLYDTLDIINPQRKRMYNAIVELNEIRKKLASGDVWQGEGASASLETFQKILNGILLEQKRLNEIAFTLSQYADELLENERQIAQRAQDVGGGIA